MEDEPAVDEDLEDEMDETELFGDAEVDDEMEPDDTFEHPGEQTPNTREQFEDEEDDLLLLEE